jgi:hypothetical protein
MTEDKQKICKCGASTAKFINDVGDLKTYVKATNAGNSTINMSAFTNGADTIYRNINKIDDDCGTDSSAIRWANAGIFGKLEKMGSIKDSELFEKEKAYIFRELDKIIKDVLQNVKECSEK